jgi:hypothetical protein
LGVIENRECEFRDKNLKIFCLFGGNESFGGKEKESLADQLPLINFLKERWELRRVVFLI